MPGEDILLSLGIDLTNIDQVASQINTRLQAQTGIGAQINQQKESIATTQEQVKANNLLMTSLQTKQKVDAQGATTIETITKFTKERIHAEQSLGEQIAMVTKRALLWGTVWSLAYGAIRAVQQTVQDTIKTFIDLDTQLTKLSIVTDVTRSQFGGLRAEFFDMAKSMGMNVTDVAGAVQTFAQQGMSVAESMELARISMIGTNITGIATLEMAENLTAAFRAFNIPVNESITILDKLVAVANKTAIEMPELSGAIQRVGSTSEAVGVSMDDLLGYVAAIGEVTRRSGAEIGRALRTIFIRTLSDTNDELLKSSAGITIYSNTAKTQFKPLGDILLELSAKWNDLNEVQRKSISEALAGQRQYDMFTALMQNFDRAIFATKASADSAGDAMEAMRKKSESLEFQINELKTAWKEVFVDTISESESPMKKAIAALTLLAKGIKEVNEAIRGGAEGQPGENFLMGWFAVIDYAISNMKLQQWVLKETQEQTENFSQAIKQMRKDLGFVPEAVTPRTLATFPLSVDTQKMVQDTTKDISKLTQEYGFNLDVVNRLSQSYKEMGISFDTDSQKLGIYQNALKSAIEDLKKLEAAREKIRRDMTEQERVLSAATPVSPEEFEKVMVEYRKNAAEALNIETQIAIVTALILSSKKGIETTQGNINDKAMQQLSNEHQINMLRIGGMSDYELALIRISQLQSDLIDDDEQRLEIQKEINKAVEAQAQALAEIESEIRSILESGFVDVLKGQSSPSEVLQGLGDVYLKIFSEKLFAPTGAFGGLISSLAEAGMEIKDPMQAAIIEGSKTGAGYFYQAITQAGMTISGQIGGLGTFPSFGGFGMPMIGTGADNIGTGATSSITWIGGKAYSTSSLLSQVAPYIAGGLQGLSVGGGGLESFIGGVTGSVIAGLPIFSAATAATATTAATAAGALAFLGPFMPIIGGLLGGMFGGSSSSVSPEQTPAPTAEALAYGDFGSFPNERPYILPESAYFGGRAGTSRPMVDNSITIDLSGAEIVGLDSTDVAEKIVDTIDRKLSTKYYRQVNERGLMNTYPR